ncbi:hypothetical protein dsx2_2252 [Desulfovibrio sp. X2]|uniref:hypothetical protein n=1 Tax=Desulfovibrio sp. X2 TaxID=941449 RepID=UPI0003587F19|nr:hypothetical protein [Desulfovibrio sp. X2]EPR43635.1 hypothetical protein dsx2_2252 [Desulfovibrio sp. X2]
MLIELPDWTPVDPPGTPEPFVPMFEALSRHFDQVRAAARARADAEFALSWGPISSQTIDATVFDTTGLIVDESL